MEKKLKMPTNKIYKQIIEISSELDKMGLHGWETEFVIKDRKKKKGINVKVIFKLKKEKIIVSKSSGES
jgi:hypothetical protein